MKHISSYKLFESINKNIESDIHDILLDFTDDGFISDVSHHKNEYEDFWIVSIKKYRPVGRFDRPNDIREELMDSLHRLQDYMLLNNYKMDIIRVSGKESSNLIPVEIIDNKFHKRFKTTKERREGTGIIKWELEEIKILFYIENHK